MDNAPYFVVPHPDRGPGCYKLEIRQKFAGKKIRRFFSGLAAEARAYAEGDRMVAQIQEKGTQSVQNQGLSVSACIKRFWAIRGPKIRSKSHRAHLTRNFKLFDEMYGKRGVKSIWTTELVKFWDREEWPDGFSTRWQAYVYMRLLFNWLERQDIIERNPFKKVDPPTEPKALAEILEPKQMAELLTLPKDWEKAWACLSGFANLRTSEALRVDPKRDFNWREKEIHVVGSTDDGKVGGTAGERYVKMEPAFVRHCPKSFKMPNTRNFYKTLSSDLRKHTTMTEIPQNALRHSWFTYHLAKYKNAALTAHEGGNSEKMVKDVYALAAKRAKQREWWAL